MFQPETKDQRLALSASEGIGIDNLKTYLTQLFNVNSSNSGVVVSNIRHFESLSSTLTSINAVIDGLANGITGNFLAIDIRQALHHLGEITGEIKTDDLLGNIFGKFCS